MTSLRMAEITIDSRDAGGLARFWADALGWQVGPGASEFVATVSGSPQPEQSLPMLFLKVPEAKAGKARIHLDLRADDLAAEVNRLSDLGATVVYEKREYGVHWFTLQDPEGNEFCVGQPDPTQDQGGEDSADDV